MQRNSDMDAVGIRVLLSVGLGTFMSALDASVVNTVLPVIRADYRVPVSVITFAIGLRHIPEEQNLPLREETFDRIGGSPRNGSSRRPISRSSRPA